MSSMANGSHNNSKTLAIRGKNQWFSFATAPEELRYGDSLKIRGTLGFDLYPDLIRGVTSKQRPFWYIPRPLLFIIRGPELKSAKVARFPVTDSTCSWDYPESDVLNNRGYTEINHLWRHRKSLSAYWFYINRYFGFFSGIAVSALPLLTLSLEYSFFRAAARGHSGRNASNSIHCHDNPGARSLRLQSSSYVVPACNGAQCGCGQRGTRLVLTLSSKQQPMTQFSVLIHGAAFGSPHDLRRLPFRFAGKSMIMALTNLANIASYYYIFAGSLATFVSSISVTMISRFILNLHENDNAGIMSQLSMPVVQHNIP
ncbi:hypothetical protein DFH07DRAFT_945390 [Mycena maculata]|uniref:Uncharacterized protein n=1 Tax=Mycena maculata TaxID=230809 RepID=A0AAD7HZD7_9AGAR|nr:hypothetical protein DFH07DRAFT_945390 [Mycena maculata]